MAILLIPSAMIVIGALVVLPVIEEAQAVKGEADRHISLEGNDINRSREHVIRVSAPYARLIG